LLKSSEQEKNKIKSVFDKVFPVAPVATFGAFFYEEKIEMTRDDAKVGATSLGDALRKDGLEGERGLEGGGGPSADVEARTREGKRGCLNDRIGSIARIAKNFSKKGRGGVPNCASSDYHYNIDEPPRRRRRKIDGEGGALWRPSVAVGGERVRNGVGRFRRRKTSNGLNRRISNETTFRDWLDFLSYERLRRRERDGGGDR
jgi:hypothetical protein